MPAQIKNNKLSTVPSSEVRCVWMTAGIISYKLCDRNDDCYNCPLDIAFRRQSGKQTTINEDGNQNIFGKGLESLHPEYHYTSNHIWLNTENADSIRIGIEPRLSSVLLNPKAVVLPSVNQPVVCNQATVWIILEDGTLPILSPLDGSVTKINTSICDSPQDIFQHPLDSGWLFEIAPCTLPYRSAKFFDAGRAEKIFERDLIRFKDALIGVLRKSYKSTGTTLADGGTMLGNISDMLGSKVYFDVVREIFCNKIPQ